jgi:hypothetical protein
MRSAECGVWSSEGGPRTTDCGPRSGPRLWRRIRYMLTAVQCSVGTRLLPLESYKRRAKCTWRATSSKPQAGYKCWPTAF